MSIHKALTNTIKESASLWRLVMVQVTKCSFMQPIQFFTIRLKTVMPYGGTVVKIGHYEQIIKAEVVWNNSLVYKEH